MLLNNKNAVIYGAAGHIGSAVARAFARDEPTSSSLAVRSRSCSEWLRRYRPPAAVAEAAQVDAPRCTSPSNGISMRLCASGWY